MFERGHFFPPPLLPSSRSRSIYSIYDKTPFEMARHHGLLPRLTHLWPSRCPHPTARIVSESLKVRSIIIHHSSSFKYTLKTRVKLSSTVGCDNSCRGVPICPFRMLGIDVDDMGRRSVTLFRFWSYETVRQYLYLLTTRNSFRKSLTTSRSWNAMLHTMWLNRFTSLMEFIGWYYWLWLFSNFESQATKRHLIVSKSFYLPV